jgi:protein involved in polysaccharide export with SLBB domain
VNSRNRPVRWVRAVWALLLLAAASPLGAQDGSVLAPGDVLRVTVFRKPELSGEMEVGPDGALLHPLYREVRVAGLSAGQLDARLRQFLLGYETEPRFMYEPLMRVTVGGEVRQPVQGLMRPATTAFQAVVAAGGGTAQARMDRVVLLRDGAPRTLNLSPGHPDGRTPVRSGDVLVVERRPPGVREYLAPAASVIAAVAAIINLTRN